MVFGIILGAILQAVIARDATLVVSVNPVSISLIVEASAVISMFLAYFGCGYLSRSYLLDCTDRLAVELPAGVRFLLASLENRKCPILADAILGAILDHDCARLAIGGRIWLGLVEELEGAAPTLRALAICVFKDDISEMAREWEAVLAKHGSSMKDVRSGVPAVGDG